MSTSKHSWLDSSSKGYDCPLHRCKAQKQNFSSILEQMHVANHVIPHLARRSSELHTKGAVYWFSDKTCLIAAEKMKRTFDAKENLCNVSCE